MTMEQFTINSTFCVTETKAKNITASDRMNLAIKVLSKSVNITDLAKSEGVTRNFLYAQANIALGALNKAFNNAIDFEDFSDNVILFYLPVTKQTITQSIISLALVCKTSIRDTITFLKIIFDYDISIGSVFNILNKTIKTAKSLNKQENLENIKKTGLDEIYHCGKPVLVVADVKSTYVALLKQEESCDGTTWGVNLLDLSEKKKLKADYSVADGGKGLRAGHKEAWPTVPCHADIFHPINDLNDLCNRLEKRAYRKIAAYYKFQERLLKPKNKNNSDLSKDTVSAYFSMVQAIKLVDEITILTQWIREDILGKIGVDYNERYMLFSFVLSELKAREPMKERFIKPVYTKLENQRDDLLAFVKLIDENLKKLADEFKVTLSSISKAYKLQGMDLRDCYRYVVEQEVYDELGVSFYPIQQRLIKIIDETIRASW